MILDVGTCWRCFVLVSGDVVNDQVMFHMNISTPLYGWMRIFRRPCSNCKSLCVWVPETCQKSWFISTTISHMLHIIYHIYILYIYISYIWANYHNLTVLPHWNHSCCRGFTQGLHNRDRFCRKTSSWSGQLHPSACEGNKRHFFLNTAPNFNINFVQTLYIYIYMLPSSWKERLIDWESSPQSTQCGLRHGQMGRPWRRRILDILTWEVLSPLGGRITASRTSTSGGTQSSLKTQLWRAGESSWGRKKSGEWIIVIYPH